MLLCATKSGIYIHSKEFLLLPNANTIPAETFLFSFLPRKPSETFTSRALCTELWRQISVALQTFILLWFSYYSTADVQMWNETILQGAFVDQFLTLPLFFHRKVYMLWWAEPRCVKETVRAWKEDVPHHQQPFWLCVSASRRSTGGVILWMCLLIFNICYSMMQ